MIPAFWPVLILTLEPKLIAIATKVTSFWLLWLRQSLERRTWTSSRGSILDGLDVQLWTTAAQDHASDPVSQENILTGPSALQPQSDAPVACIFGGDGMVKEAAVGPSSLASSASTLVKFLAKHAAWGNGPRSPGSSRNGRMSGVRTYVESRGDGLDWAFTVNTDEFTDNWADTMFWNGVSQINLWLNTGPVS